MAVLYSVKTKYGVAAAAIRNTTKHFTFLKASKSADYLASEN